MSRVSHGATKFVERESIPLVRALGQLEALGGSAESVDLASMRSQLGFSFMFPDLQSDEFKLPATKDTVNSLIALAEAMSESSDNSAGDSDIPTAYTYLGQFVDHDITLEAFVKDAVPQEKADSLRELAELGPLNEPEEILVNLRSGPLDLDSVYNGAPFEPANASLFELSKVSNVGSRPPGKDEFNDLPRQDRTNDPKSDRAAKIGDPRNDENLVISQLHLAFLRAHNALVANGNSFAEAKSILGNLYLDAVFNDFLARICDADTRSDVFNGEGRKFWSPNQPTADIPIEFSAAVYRFGHSMVRGEYDFNLNFPAANFALLFTFARLKGSLGGQDTLPQNWIIEWERFLGNQFARKIDARITPPLNINMPADAGATAKAGMKSLGERNLLRGFLLGLPTGQSVAQSMGLTPLTGAEILSALPQSMQDAARPFENSTPLWFYVLAEAESAGDGNTLGPLGSRIVCETLHALGEASTFDMPEFSDSPNNSLHRILELSGNL